MTKMVNLEEQDDGLGVVLRSNGKSKTPFDFNLLEYFYKTYEKHPFVYMVDGESMYYDWDKVKERFDAEFKSQKVLFTSYMNNIDTDKIYTNVLISEITEGVVISVKCLDASNVYFDDLVLTKDETLMNDIQILTNGEIDPELLKKINIIFKETKIEEKETVSIGMVSMSDGEYYVKDFDITDGVLELTDLDLHYGDGFSAFNDSLLERMLKETKGLVLFHGSPGSGKTTFVRHLLKTIKAENNENNILYFPPTMVDAVTDPGFIDFISNWAYSAEGKNYLLIEDAEPLLESRDQSRNMGITNLLNMTDGLLNDILNLQIIATFNTELKNIDSALLRPERLLGRKNFRNLSKKNALILAEKIGVDTSKIIDGMSLAEIYSLKNETVVLIHDIEDNTKKIGFN